MSIKVPISASLNQGDINQQIRAIEKAFNELGKSAEKAGKIKFTPISNTTLEQAKEIRKQFEAMVRLSPGLQSAMAAGSQQGKRFEQVDWSEVWTNEQQRYNHAQTVLSRIGPGSMQAIPQASGTGGGQPPLPPGGGASSPGAGRGFWRSAMAGGIAGGVGTAFGQIGGLGGALASGAITGGLAGGPIGAAVGAFTASLSTLLGSLGEARDVAVSLDSLKRQLGDVNISFTDLRKNTRGLADEYALSDAEASSLTSAFAARAGNRAGGTSDLLGGASVGIGFARSFGMDPRAGVDFFGRMRGAGVTQNAEGDKRLAVMIGEAVARAGDFPRMSEVLGSLGNYMEHAARASLSSPGAAGWLAQYSALSQGGLAGMNPQTAASMIGNVDNAIRAGGITEAGKNFMSLTLQREMGLDPIQARLQLEGGAFGTGRGAFGPDSASSRFYARFGGGAPFASWGSDVSNISMLQNSLIKAYRGKSPNLMADAFSNTFGTTLNQSMAWLATDPSQVDGMSKRLSRLGINWKDVNASGIARLSSIEANGNLSESEKDVRARQAAEQSQEKTEGSEARKAMIATSNAVIRLSGEGLPMLSNIQMAVLKIAGIDPYGPQRKALEDARNDRIKAIDQGPLGKAYRDAKAKFDYNTGWGARTTGIGLSDEQKALKADMDAKADALLAATGQEQARYARERKALESGSPGTGGLSDEVAARAIQEDQSFGFAPGTTAGLIMQESSGNRFAVSSKGAKGILQIMPENVANLSKEAGRQLDPTNVDDAFSMYHSLMLERQKKYNGNTEKMLRSYHGGYDEDNWGKINADYVPAIGRRMDELKAGNGNQTMNHNVNVTLRDPNNQPIPADIVTETSLPSASGQ